MALPSTLRRPEGNDPEAKRFRRLVDVIDKALEESKKGIDTKAAIVDSYGDDASIFGGGDDGNDMLSKLLEGMIDRVNDRVKTEVMDVLKKECVNDKLLRFENLIEHFEQIDQEEREVEKNDKNSARNAADEAKLPGGITPEDIINFHAYRVKTQERDQLLAEVTSIEAENEAIQSNIQQANDSIKKYMDQMDAKGKSLEGAADLCSFSVVS
mmetsp:Transcript_5792/g.10261  ORF Transcript_5792/g.10261 Transcript_5792/m.10261 type:complete len:212 (-) Transcript_5792:150-785(-)|eukprot:CAMPEP_0198294358 /NCGR_PEP_ID=MMETSP1449-20131203/22007_1 /TAXON_ID=420275 /ORGANISM="Attheya septentrionalis, Strain CCMP2084" /LENGTH=211 /DNA_ID=CAMNT_0043994289 /DNA_START=150 /DNA_END=785 /DNA_ORIENTATION=+